MILKTARRIAILVIGTTVLIVGVIMIVAPGPAIVVIPAGLAILATEFVWADRLLKRMKAKAVELADRVRGVPVPTSASETQAEREQMPGR